MRIFMIVLLGALTMISCIKQETEGDMAEPVTTFGYGNIEMDIPSTWKEVASLNLVEFTAHQNQNLRIIGNSFGLDISTENMQNVYIEKLKKRFSEITSENITTLENGIFLIELEGGFYKRPSPSSKSFVLLKNHKILSALIPTSRGTINLWLDEQIVTLGAEAETFKNFLLSYRQVVKEYSLKENGTNEIIASTLESLKIEALENSSQSDKISGNRFDFSLFSLAIPDGWIYSKPESDMRLAEFVLKENSEYRVVAFSFGQVDFDNKKMIEANITRWRGQFSSLEREERLPLHNENFALVNLEGTYVKKPPMAEQGVDMPNFSLLAGIIPTEQGPYYFRLEAPKEVAKTQQRNFQYFLNSYEEDLAALAREVEDILETDDDVSDRETHEEDDNMVEEDLRLADFSLQIPTSWKKTQPSSSMRAAEYILKNAPEYSIVIYSFGKASFGNVEEMITANVNRWEQQFTTLDSKEKITTTAPNSALIYLTGTFVKKPFPMAEQGVDTPNYATLNGIIDSETGPYFFRLEAPKNIAEGQIDIFKNFINSYKK